MIADDLSQGWYDEKRDKRKRGRQREYSDFAIEQCLKIRCLFGLKLRQTQGFIEYIFEISGLDLKCPDYSLISKRCKKLGLSTVLIKTEEEFDYVSIDSTGIQVVSQIFTVQALCGVTEDFMQQ